MGRNVGHAMEIVDKDKPGKGHLSRQITPSSSLKHFKNSIKLVFLADVFARSAKIPISTLHGRMLMKE